MSDYQSRIDELKKQQEIILDRLDTLNKLHRQLESKEAADSIIENQFYIYEDHYLMVYKKLPSNNLLAMVVYNDGIYMDDYHPLDSGSCFVSPCAPKDFYDAYDSAMKKITEVRRSV